MDEEKKGFQLDWVQVGRQVLVGPFRMGPDGRLEIEEGAGLGLSERDVYAADAHEQAHRKEDPDFDRRWTEIEEELVRRRPGAILRGKWTVYYDFTGEPDLLARWKRLLDGAAAATREKKPKTIGFRQMGELVDRYAALVALRDPEGYAEARRKKTGKLFLIARYPDLKAQFDEELRALPPSDPSRRSEHHMQELPWKNPLPARGLSGAALAGYWSWAYEVRAKRKAQLETKRDDWSESYRRWRKERWTQIGMLEGILDLLHRVLAPDAPFCGQGCTHLEDGLGPEQAKRFIDSLDAFRAITEYESEENYTAEYACSEMKRRLAETAET